MTLHDDLRAELAELLGEDVEVAETANGDEIRVAIARGMRRLQHLADRALHVTAMVDDELRALTRWRDERLAPIQAQTLAAEERLAMLHAMLLEQDPKALTVDVPAGVHGSKMATKPTVKVLDEERFVEWALEQRPDLLRTRHAPDIAAVRKAFQAGANELGVVADPATGELVPGLGAEQPTRQYHVRLAGRDD